MRCSACYRSIEDEFMHRVSGKCRVVLPAQSERTRPAWKRPSKVREHSGPWPSAKHGTRSRYQGNRTQKGCRCGDCVKANYEYHAAWRKKRRQEVSA